MGVPRGVGRFIPAWAGNTVALTLQTEGEPVHPRVGGEHYPAEHITFRSFGSSPRGRGTLEINQRCVMAARFIPAWAGNTPPRVVARYLIWVHPRVGGEHKSAFVLARMMVGSSPRGRGTRYSAPAPRSGGRFIPAWAGNTYRTRIACGRSAVHPRVGGEHENCVKEKIEHNGSSPRGRGTPHLGWCSRLAPRFIPAWAGNTSASARPGFPVPVHPRVGGEHR